MLAIEFTTHARNGMIKIPEQYRKMVDGELKIIVLKEVEKTRVSINKKNTRIKKLLKQIQEKNIFQKIENPVEWQRAIRDEWA